MHYYFAYFPPSSVNPPGLCASVVNNAWRDFAFWATSPALRLPQFPVFRMPKTFGVDLILLNLTPRIGFHGH